MKIKSLLLKFLNIFLITSFLISTLTSCSTRTAINTYTETCSPEQKFLSSNYSTLNINDNGDFSSFKLLDSTLKDKEIFFSGENHGVKSNYDIRLKLLKYFHEKSDVKYYLNEVSYSDAYFLNKYLESGDEHMLKQAYKCYEGTSNYNKQSYEHWKEVYKYNSNLPPKDKIVVVGIDIERQPEIGLLYMRSVLPNKSTSPKITSLIKNLNKLNSQKILYRNNIKQFSLNLKQSIKSNKELYKEYLGNNFLGFELVNENILCPLENYNSPDFDQIRDSKMCDNLKKIYSTLPKGKFFGQFGLDHTLQKRNNGVDWIASLLNNDKSIFKNKVLSIALLYKNCKEMTASIKDKNGNPYALYSTKDLYTYDSRDNLIDNFCKSDTTVFKLTGDKSPFEQKPLETISLNYSLDILPDVIPTDYVQYIILIKNSPAVEPLNI